MRLPVFAAILAAFAAPGFAQTPPDASPSTPVDEVVMLPFEPSREDAVLEGYVDGVVGAHMREHGAPAVAVSVVRNGRIVFAKAYGEADAETHALANGQDTLFRIGSVSKTFIWTAVMMLQERGLLNLDADVNTYLKDLQIPAAFGAPVTMNDLMAHRAGFEDTLAVFGYADDGETSMTQALEETMPKRVYAPGARTSYSNWGAALAAKIVEDVAGVPYAQFIESEILKPLAMTHTTIRAPKLMNERERAAMAKGYSIKAGAPELSDYMEIGPFAAAGAMASSAGDMAVWSLFHLGEGEHDGVRLMRAETHRLMTTRAFNDRPGGADLAHGLMARPYRGVDTFGHGGATALFYTYWMIAPELDAGVFVSQSAAESRALVNEMPWLVLDHLIDRPLTTAPDDPAFEERASAFAGVYLDNRRAFSTFEKLFAVSGAEEVAAAPGGGLTLTYEGESHHYAPVPGLADTFESRDGQRLVFGRDAKGRVTHFSGGGGVHSSDRIRFASNPTLIYAALGLSLLLAATTLLGAWRRQGRGGGKYGAGGIWGLSAIAGAVCAGAFALSLAWMGAELSNASPATMLAYPPLSVIAVRFAGFAALAAAAFMLTSLWPIWRASPWGLARKIHHSLFTAAMVWLSLMLIVWKVIFSATA